MNSLMLTIDDAIKVAMTFTEKYLDNYSLTQEDVELLRQDMEQKCWVKMFPENPIENIKGLISDVNPAEIVSHIQNDNLTTWCESWQASVQIEIRRIIEGDGE